MMIYLYVALGGIIGSLSRYLIFKQLSNQFVLGIPIPILFINVVGSFLLGVFYQLTIEFEINENLKSFISIGILSSFTTFSTFSLEFINLIINQKIFEAIIYLISTIVLSCLFLLLGIWIVKTY